MKLDVIKIGRPAFDEYQALTQMYQKRLNSFCKTSISFKKKLPEDFLLKRYERSRSFLVCVDERGLDLSSIEFSKKLSGWIESPSSSVITFLIGGPYGIDEKILSQADFCWRLSGSTMTSDLAWLVASEQIYRALSIIHRTPYHH